MMTRCNSFLPLLTMRRVYQFALCLAKMDMSTRCYKTSEKRTGILERCTCSHTRESATVRFLPLAKSPGYSMMKSGNTSFNTFLSTPLKRVNFSLMLPNGGVGVMRLTVTWFLHLLHEDLT